MIDRLMQKRPAHGRGAEEKRSESRDDDDETERSLGMMRGL